MAPKKFKTGYKICSNCTYPIKQAGRINPGLCIRCETLVLDALKQHTDSTNRSRVQRQAAMDSLMTRQYAINQGLAQARQVRWDVENAHPAWDAATMAPDPPPPAPELIYESEWGSIQQERNEDRHIIVFRIVQCACTTTTLLKLEFSRQDPETESVTYECPGCQGERTCETVHCRPDSLVVSIVESWDKSVEVKGLLPAKQYVNQIKTEGVEIRKCPEGYDEGIVMLKCRVRVSPQRTPEANADYIAREIGNSMAQHIFNYMTKGIKTK